MLLAILEKAGGVSRTDLVAYDQSEQIDDAEDSSVSYASLVTTVVNEPKETVSKDKLQAKAKQ